MTNQISELPFPDTKRFERSFIKKKTLRKQIQRNEMM
jgi:hypothetical protein